jgi:hypothetical protein
VIAISVVPRSSSSGIEQAPGGALRVRVTASPVDGAANAAVLQVLADAIGVRKSSLEIVSGVSARWKRILALGIAPPKVDRRIRRRLEPPG